MASNIEWVVVSPDWLPEAKCGAHPRVIASTEEFGGDLNDLRSIPVDLAATVFSHLECRPAGPVVRFSGSPAFDWPGRRLIVSEGGRPNSELV
ncbi:MAG: hypothetical protein ACKV0T_21085 [Planctomycetales bacterium]